MEYPKGYMTPKGLQEVKAASDEIIALNAVRRQQREAWANTTPAPMYEGQSQPRGPGHEDFAPGGTDHDPRHPEDAAR